MANDQPKSASAKKRSGAVKKAATKKIGRPREAVPQDKADAIIAWISQGETLRQWCRENGVHFSTVYLWLDKDQDFARRFARAREAGEEVIAQECIEIADDATNDWMEKVDKDGALTGWQLNGEHVQRSKLRIETRLKLLAKWNPKKYGEKVDVNHGGQAENPVAMVLKQVSGTALPVVANPED